MVFMIESQVAYVVDALQTMDAEGLGGRSSRRRRRSEAYRDLSAEKSKGTVWIAGGCASWYLDEHGRNTTLWPDFTFRFRKLTRKLDRENYVGTPPPAEHPGGGRVTAADRAGGRGRRRPHARRRRSCTPPSTAPTTPPSPSSSPTAGRCRRRPGTTSPTCSPPGSPTASCG